MQTVRGNVEFEDLAPGTGLPAARGCTVSVCYDLYLNRGGKVQDQQTCTFRIGERRVIAGLEYGVEGMRVGGRRRLRVGPHLGYGDKGVPGRIPPNALLEFHVTLLAAEDGESAASEVKNPSG
jgi:FKBP-type peptidyl-prolyl cis-trans isomerase